MDAKTIIKRILVSKKVWVAFTGLAVAVFSAAGLDIPPDKLAMLYSVIKWIVGTFCGGQGLADGLSKGRTSAGRDMYD